MHHLIVKSISQHLSNVQWGVGNRKENLWLYRPCYRCRQDVAVGTYKRLRQRTQRKPLQKQQQQQYMDVISKETKQSDDGNLLFDLRNETPSSQAAQAAMIQQAEVNQRLQQQLSMITSWQEIASIVEMYSQQLNFMTVGDLILRLGLLVRSGHGPRQQPAEGADSANDSPSQQRPDGRSQATTPTDGQRYQSLLFRCAQLVAQHGSWFTAKQYAQVSFGLAAAGLPDRAFWAVFTASSERKLVSCTSNQLALLITGIGWAGHTPTMQWIKKSEGQLLKHWNVVGRPDLCAVLWAWGKFSFTPAKPLVKQIQERILGSMRSGNINAQQLLQVLYFMSRLSAHHPRTSWLNAWCTAFTPHMHQAAPGVLADVLLCLASLQHSPHNSFTHALLHHMLGIPSKTRGETTTTNKQNTADMLQQYTGSPAAVGQAAQTGGFSAGYRSVDDLLASDDVSGYMQYQEDSDNLNQGQPQQPMKHRNGNEDDDDDDDNIQGSLQMDASDPWPGAQPRKKDVREQHGHNKHHQPFNTGAGFSDLVDTNMNRNPTASSTTKDRVADAGAAANADDDDVFESFLLDEDDSYNKEESLVNQPQRLQQDIHEEDEELESFLMDEDDHQEAPRQSPSPQPSSTMASGSAQQVGILEVPGNKDGNVVLAQPLSGLVSGAPMPSSQEPEMHSATHESKGATLLLRPQQGMVPDLLTCGPMSDLRYPTWANAPGASQHQNSIQNVIIPRAGTITRGQTAEAGNSRPTSRTETLQQQQQQEDKMKAAGSQQSDDGQDFDPLGLAPGHLQLFDSRLQARHLGIVAWSLGTVYVELDQLWLDTYTALVLDNIQELDGAVLVDVLYGLSNLIAPQTSITSQPINVLPQPLQQVITASEAVQAPPSLEGAGILQSATLDRASATLDRAQLDRAQSSNVGGVQSSEGESEAASGNDGLNNSSSPDNGMRLQPGFLAALADALETQMDSLEPDALAQAVVAFTRLGFNPGQDWLQQLAAASKHKLPSFSAWSLPDMLTGLVALGHQPTEEWWQRFEAAMLPLLPHCPPSHVTRVAWALAAAQHKPDVTWLHQLLVMSHAKFKRMDERDLCTLIWCFAKLRHRPGPRWLDSYTTELSLRMGLLGSQSIADVCWGLAALGFRPTSDWLQQLDDALQARLAEVSPQQMAVILWAYSQWKHVPNSYELVQRFANTYVSSTSSINARC